MVLATLDFEAIMRSFRHLLLLAVIGAVPCGPLALAGQVLTPGVRVRATSRIFGAVVGSLVTLESDTLVMQPAGRSDTIRLYTADLARIEVSRGRHRETLHGAGVGAVLGGAVGAVLAPLALHASGPIASAYAAVVGAGAGAVLGLFIGASRTTEGWARTELPSASTSSTTHVQVAPVGRRGIAVVVSRTF